MLPLRSKGQGRRCLTFFLLLSSSRRAWPFDLASAAIDATSAFCTAPSNCQGAASVTPPPSPLSLTRQFSQQQQQPRMMIQQKVLEQIKATGKARIRDEGRVLSLLKSVMEGGYGKLQVIVDFDYTLTRVHRDGETLHCSWGVFETSKFVPKRYLEETAALRSKYLPIELDAHMSIEEKTPHMVEWYKEANRMLTGVGTVNRKNFADMVRDSNVELREGTQEMMTRLADVSVPVLVLSAGLGDMVREILVELQAMHPNMHLVSNFLKYDMEGNIVGMASEEVIHVYNKNEKSLKKLASEDFLRQIHARKNIVLMGDSLGDIGMANGVDDPEAVLKIGFLNHGEESEADQVRLRKYLDAYDIVLVDDQTMDVAKLIMQQMDKAAAAGGQEAAAAT